MEIQEKYDSINPKINSTIKTIIGDFEKSSGVKKDSMLIIILIFFFFVFLGFGGSYILIISSKTRLGGIFIIFTSLSIFFIFMFFLQMRGDQLFRVTRYIEEHKENLKDDALGVGYDVIFSFQRG